MLTYFAKGEDRDVRLRELASRCLIARNKFEEAADSVTGIGFNEFDPAIGSATDLIYMSIDTSNGEWRQEAKQLENDCEYFKRRPKERIPADEFPIRKAQ